ncbi:aspartyl/asparaginyl beta-hydroxylase isoform X14 [Xenopus tropicalis]|uniref:Aspartyl/asparaginyl beta-hydroxylase isoform X14 n=1 Tax=Xenopus tropicalis TaxID=8364 RepID=A0A8J1JMW3_XENTR|nr:aspartyl/asparaginyl beta-hydroxylase isoform X14 [Xenopus tropicalis]
MSKSSSSQRKNPKGGKKVNGGKNGKKEGLSGSSFFTWFMVIALLGVWTSVAVVWFDLVDYEEVLAKAQDFRYNLSEALQGKLGVYDTDGDGDFDVDDAKILLGISPGKIDKKETKAPGEEPGGLAKTKTKVKEEIKEQLKKVKEKIVVQKKEPKVAERKKPVKETSDKARKPQEGGRPKKEQERDEPRQKKDEKHKEPVKRTTSGKATERERGKRPEKKENKDSKKDDKRK